MKKRFSISLLNRVFEELEKMAQEKGFTKSDIITLALEEYMKGEEK